MHTTWWHFAKKGHLWVTYLEEESFLSRLDPSPPSSLAVDPKQTLKRKTEQKMSAPLCQLVEELKRLSELHRFSLTKTSVTSCATSLSHFRFLSAF